MECACNVGYHGRWFMDFVDHVAYRLDVTRGISSGRLLVQLQPSLLDNPTFHNCPRRVSIGRITVVAVDKRAKGLARASLAPLFESLAAELWRYMATRIVVGPARAGELLIPMQAS
jgi:hypothetical protein